MPFRWGNTSQPNISRRLYGITKELLTKTAKMGISTEMDLDMRTFLRR